MAKSEYNPHVEIPTICLRCKNTLPDKPQVDVSTGDILRMADGTWAIDTNVKYHTVYCPRCRNWVEFARF